MAMRRLDAPSGLAQTIYRTEDGSEWATLEQAENHEKRIRLLSEKLSELGGTTGLYQLIAKDAERDGGFAYERFADVYNQGHTVTQVAHQMDEIVALAALLKPILDECGPNPYPLNY